MSVNGKDEENNRAAVEGEKASIALAMKLQQEDKQMLEEEARKEVEEKRLQRKKRRSKQKQAVQREAEDLGAEDSRRKHVSIVTNPGAATSSGRTPGSAAKPRSKPTSKTTVTKVVAPATPLTKASLWFTPVSSSVSQLVSQLVSPI